jgi:hypothetical protein
MDPNAYAVRAPLAVAAVVLVLLATGCSNLNPGTTAAAETAAKFHSALEAGDTRAACALLAPAAVGKLENGQSGSCPGKLAALSLPAAGEVGGSRAFGSNAQVQLESDTVFLTLSGDRWKITAAGCTPRGEKPYDCEVEGN